MQELEDDVVPLDITGSVKIYSQAYITKQEKHIANLQSELEHKKLAIKNRNTRIKNLKANITGTQNALEQAKKQLIEAKEIIDIFLDFESTCQERGVYISNEYRKKARQFLGEEG